MRFLTCRACGHAYTASLTGHNTCPRCRTPARPGDDRADRVTCLDLDGHTLITVTGPMYKLKELEDLKGHIDHALSGDPGSMAFHFDGVGYLDSSMIGQMVRAVQEMTKRSKPTYVITSDPQLVEALQILDLDRVLTVLPSVQAYKATLG